MIKFKVEHHCVYGWDDAGWTEDDKPLRFDSVTDAQAAIAEHIADTVAAAERGDMVEAYDVANYRIVPALDDPTTALLSSFSYSTLLTILEAAHFAMNHPASEERVADHLDISDEEMSLVRSKLAQFLNEPDDCGKTSD